MSTRLRRFLAGNLPVDASYSLFQAADTQRLVPINPSRISSILEGPRLLEFLRRSQGRLIVRSQDYNDLVDPLKDRIPHPTVRALWVEGIDYRETEQYKTMIAAVDAYLSGECDDPKRRGAYWCRSREDVDEYFRILIKAYENIRDHGYRSQLELGQRIGDELRILIDRTGKPVFHASRANHRFSICRLLDIPEVPVHIVAIDTDWLRENCSHPGRGFRRRIDSILDSVQANLANIAA